MESYIFSSLSMDEGCIVSDFAEFLRKKKWHVVVARPNNSSIFFTLPGGKRKAPDIISFRKPYLLVAEAKPTSSRLLESKSGKMSDFDSMLYLFSSREAKSELIERVYPRLNTDIEMNKVRLQAAVVSGELKDRSQLPLASPVSWIIKGLGKIPKFKVEHGLALEF